MGLIDRIFNSESITDTAVEFAMKHPNIDIILRYDDQDDTMRITLTDGVTTASRRAPLNEALVSREKINAFWLSPILQNLVCKVEGAGSSTTPALLMYEDVWE